MVSLFIFYIIGILSFLTSENLMAVVVADPIHLNEGERLSEDSRVSKRAPFYPAISVNRTQGSDIFRERQAHRSYIPELIWPHICVDRRDRIHMITTTNTDTLGGTPAGTPQPTAYFRSDDLGRSWVGPIYIDTIYTISSVVTASRHSDKVAIVYSHPLSPDLYVGDIYYLESTDGVSWDLSAKVNATNFTTFDSMRAYCDLDAIYDEEDELHIVFSAAYYYGGSTRETKSFLMHWSRRTGLTQIASALYATYPGSWNLTISKPNIGINPRNGYLYVTWTQFFPDDISAGGYSNGDICAAVSTDNGLSWYPAHNLTRTASPGALPGNCNSDHWASLAEIVNDTLHIIYINDKDAGGIPQGEGEWTYNPVKYLALPAHILVEPPVTTPNLESPGVIVGHTWYDYQHNASMGKMIALDRSGGVHLIYMKGFDSGASIRHIMYNYKPAGGEFLWEEGVRVEGMTRSGYGTLALLSDGRAVPGYHTDMIPEDREGPTASLEYPTINSFSSCANQSIIIRLTDPRGVDPTGIIVDVNHTRYIWGTSELSFIEPNLIFTPRRSFADGETVRITLVDAVDSLGNHMSNPISWQFFIDLSPPFANLVFPRNGSIISCADTTISVLITDRFSGVNRDSVLFSLNGIQLPRTSTRWIGDTVKISPSFPFFEGNNRLILQRAADNAQYCSPNSTYAEWQFTVDLTGPTCEVISPVPNTIVDTTEPNITLRITDNYTSVSASSIEIEINESRLTIRNRGVNFLDGYLRINTHDAGLTFVPGESVNVRLISAYDTPEFCAPNFLFSPCEFWFFVPAALARLATESGSPGDTIIIPLAFDNIAGTIVNSVSFSLSVDTSIAFPLGIVLDGALLPSYTAIEARVNGGQLVATLSDFSVLALDTTFFFVAFVVNPRASTGEYCEINLNSVIINGRSRANTENGTIIVSWRKPLWSIDLYYGSEEIIIGNITIGLSPYGTDGFDAGLDRIYIPGIPEEPSCAIPVNDPRHPYARFLSRQIKNSNDLPAIFPIISYNQGLLKWFPSTFPAGRFLLNYELDMRIDSSYTFADNETIIIEYSQPTIDIFPLRLKQGWNLVSLPVIPLDYSFERVFPTAIGYLYRYDAENRRYSIIDEPTAGDGFFILSRIDTTYTISGISVERTRKRIFSGWNMIGTPNAPAPLPVEFIRSEPIDAIVPGTVFELAPSGVYEISTYLAPGKGYWILARTRGVLVIERSR